MPDILTTAGLPAADAAAWQAAGPTPTADFAADHVPFTSYWRLSDQLLARLPPRPARTPTEAEAATLIHTRARAARDRFLRRHAEALYNALTNTRTRFVRVEDLVLRAADLLPGLVPDPTQLAAEAARKLKDKEGHEIDQGLLLAHILAHPVCGMHLCHAMLLPHPDSAAGLQTLRTRGETDLGPVHVMRRGAATHLLSRNPRYLNAEDQTTITAMEIGVDIATLDPDTSIAVLRGEPVGHPKYAGRRIFGSGINLTHLYQGTIPFIWYPRRELGFVHKYFRGVATPDQLPDDASGTGTEKPWVAAIEGWAIGGHCQILLTMDYVLAAQDAFMTLPARKEGIIPGAANLRLPRFTGDRIARQLIQAERRLECDSSEGRLICDEIVPPDQMDAAIDRTTTMLASAGAVGAIGNRRALRVGAEPLDLFRRYCAVYAREQAFCHFSDALVRNLEQNWGADRRS